MIEAKQVSKSFGNRKVLNKLNFSLQQGEIVALIGQNGIGKTTLIRTLCGLYHPDSGSIEIDGVPFTQDTPSLRAKIGVVLHSTMMYPNLSCRENLDFYASLYDIDKKSPRIPDLISLLNLEARSSEKVRTLSRGLQQRLSIARALVHDPRYLLMDEVFSGLDQHSLSELTSILIKQAGDGKGILFSTHEIDKVFSIATRVIILHQGAVVFSSPVSDLSPQALIENYSAFTDGIPLPDNELRVKP